jgi:hypothetical protein
MARDASGVYSLPAGAGNPVQPGSTITASWANETFNDVATALTDSLDRNGRGGMLSPLEFSDGVVGAPGITWSQEPSSGFWRADLSDMRVSLVGSDRFRWTSNDVEIWADGQWNSVLYANASGGGLVPDGTAALQSLAWDNNTTEWVANNALLIDYTVGDISVAQDIHVAGLVDGRDVEIDGSVLDNHVGQLGAGTIHFPDAPSNTFQYARQGGEWVVVAATGSVVPDGNTDGQTLKWDQSTLAWLNTSDVIIDDAGNMGVGISPVSRISTDGDVVAGIGGFGWLGNGSVGLRGLNVSTQGMFADGNQTDIRGTDIVLDDQSGSLTTLTNGRMGIGAIPNASSVLDVNGTIYTENKPLVSGAKRFVVQATLPTTTDPDTLYFLTS